MPFPEPQAVKDALAYHLKFVQLMPGETEYSTVNTLFLEGKADSTIGGPWMVPSAREAGIELGIAPMPVVDETGMPLAPYSGVQGVHVLTHAAGKQKRGRARRAGGALRAGGRRGSSPWPAAAPRRGRNAMMTRPSPTTSWCRPCAPRRR